MKNLVLLFCIMLSAFFAHAQPVQNPATTGLGQPDPAYMENLWYSNNKVVLGYAAPAGAVIDGAFDDNIWGTTGFNTSTNTFPNAINQSSMWGYLLNGDQSIVGLPTPDKYSGTNSTFAVAWDTTNLYVAISVNSNEYLTAKNNLSIHGSNFGSDALAVAGSNIYIAADNSNRSYNKQNGVFLWGPAAFPRAYGPTDYQFGVGPNIGKTNKRATIDDGTIGIFQGPFTDQSVNAFIRETSQGYNIEMAIAWRSINSPFINLGTGLYNDITKMPIGGIVLGLDVSINIPTSDGSTTQAQLQWNQCCVNRGWSESIHFGVLSLTGTPIALALADINISPNPLNISDKNPKQLTVSVSPSEASAYVAYSVINPDSNKPVNYVSETGLVYPLNNGTATIIGTSLSKLFATSGFVKSTTSVIVNVTNQPDVTSVFAQADSITQAWGQVMLNAQVIPADAFQGVKWSFQNPTTLATLDMNTGLLKATGLGNGTVYLQASSMANNTVLGLTSVTISNQPEINSGSLNIRTYTNVACGGQGFNETTLTGYTDSTDIAIVAEYFDSDLNTYSSVPPDLMSYKLKSKVGGGLSPSIASLKTINGQTFLTVNTRQKIDFKIEATYLNNPTVTVTSKFNADTTLTSQMPILSIIPFNGNIGLTVSYNNPLFLPSPPSNSILGYNYQWLYNGRPQLGENYGILKDTLKIGTYSLVVTVPGCGVYTLPDYVNTVIGCKKFSTYKPSVSVVGTNLQVLNPFSGASYQWKFNGNNEIGQNSSQHTSAVQIGNYQMVASLSGCSFISYSDNYIITNVFVTVPGIITIVGGSCDIFKVTKPAIMRQQNNLATNVVSAGIGYEWLFNGSTEAGQTTYSHTSPLQEGGYQVKLSLFGCTETIYSDIRHIVPVTQVVTVTIVEVITISGCPTAVADAFENVNINAYPNPNAGSFYLSAEGESIGNVELFNSQGTLVYKQLYKDQVQISPAVSGIYLVKVFNLQGILMKKLRVVIE